MKKLSMAAMLGLLFVISAAVLLTQNTTEAQVTPFPSREKVISVTGIATSEVSPDLLVLQFGVETQQKTAKQALESNTNTMNQVINAIKSSGIAEDEISTSRFNIQPVYEGFNEDGRYKQELVGYKVTNSVTVKTSQLSLGAEIIDSAVNAGANRVDSIYFTLSPQKELEIKDNMLEQAILNAKEKAEKALAPLNHQIIGVKAISLTEFGIPPPIPLYAADFAIAESTPNIRGAPTPVFESDQQVTTSANVIFLIGSN